MGKSPISRSEAESNGWTIVHEDEGQGHYRAEKYIDSNTKIEAVGVSEGKLLESINAQEAHRAGFPDLVPSPVDEDGVQVDEAGIAVRSVIVPDGEYLTDAEWSSRDDGEAIIRDHEDGMQFEGPTEAALEADEARRELSADKENLLKAEPDNGPVEQIEQESLRDHQLQDVLIVREGEESLGEVIDRKLDESAKAESDRVDAGLGIGPVDLQPDEEGDLQPVPMGGPSEYFDPRELDAGVDSAHEMVEIREDAEVEKAEELRDEHGKEADAPEHAGEVVEAGSEAQQEAKDEAEESQDSDESEHVELEPGESVEVDAVEAPEATPAAEELATEKNVDLSQVRGSGKDGKITKPDVESALENDPED